MGDLWEVLTRHFPQFADGFWITCQLVGISFLIAMVVGVFVAALRVQPLKPLKFIGTVYVEVFRNIPLLVLLFIMFLGLRRAGVEIGRWVAATMSLGLYTAAYVAEAIRSGVFTVGKGQIDASLSLGFTYPETLRKVVLPQAIRTVIPPIGNLIIAMIKNSAIIGVSVLALRDLLKEARLINSRTFQTNEVFFWAAVGYLLLTVTATFIVRYLEKRLAIRR
ncbi:MAG TPA: amino acid ABC transporter permease [Actinomycetota bacterium]|nr:amino acid ABC transporter permease [Actinomycetota bacterium]